MKTLLYCLLVVLLVTCQRSNPDLTEPETYVKPEYADWYTFHAPTNLSIQGVWGDIDKTLLVAGVSSIHRSTDRGKTWTRVYNNHPAFGLVMVNDTLFTLTGQMGKPLVQGITMVMYSPGLFSVDDGKTWRPYSGRHNKLGYDAVDKDRSKGVAFDPVVASTNTEYGLRTSYGNEFGLVRGSGIFADRERSINLPNTHLLTSLYLDSKQRVYVVGSAALCNTGFCQPKTSESVVYVSKKPLP